MNADEHTLCIPAVFGRPVFGRRLTNELDHERWRSQRDVVRDIMLSAAETGVWLTLAELGSLTCFPVQSIGAQVRALRRSGHGAYIVEKRRRSSLAGRRFNSGVPIDNAFQGTAWEYKFDLLSSRTAEKRAAVFASNLGRTG